MKKGESIPISALQHAAFCLRQAALIHLERMWEDNHLTAQGQVLHAVTDRGDKRKIAGVRRVAALPLFSKTYNLSGIADQVEFIRKDDGGEIAFPIEYKRGKPKLHRADEVQLCAQAFCLEEMFEQPVVEGALFYWEIRRRVIVPFDAELRDFTRKIIVSLVEVFLSGQTPPPLQEKRRCRSCSLSELCRPNLPQVSVQKWLGKMVDRIISQEKT